MLSRSLATGSEYVCMCSCCHACMAWQRPLGLLYMLSPLPDLHQLQGAKCSQVAGGLHGSCQPIAAAW